MLELAGQFDAFLCGDDAITRAVLQKSLPRLKVISKYGIGLDKIDVKSATEFKIPVLFTPGVNHTTVAEHTFALLLAAVRNLVPEVNYVAKGQWKRLTGHEICGKTLGHRRPGPDRQGGRHPRARLRAEAHRLRHLLAGQPDGRTTACSATRTSTNCSGTPTSSPCTRT